MEKDSLTGRDMKEKALGQKSDCDVSDAKNTWIVGKNSYYYV